MELPRSPDEFLVARTHWTGDLVLVDCPKTDSQLCIGDRKCAKLRKCIGRANLNIFGIIAMQAEVHELILGANFMREK